MSMRRTWSPEEGKMPEPTSKKESFFGTRIILWIFCALLGGFVFLANPYRMNPDGVSYLSIANSYLRGDWLKAVDAYWSPFYSWLLALMKLLFQPSLDQEFFYVNLVNLLVYLVSIFCFDYFMRCILEYRRARTVESPATGQELVLFPDTACLILGFSIFLYASLRYITVNLSTPDMCLLAVMCLAAGMLFRIRMQAGRKIGIYVLLGMALGLGYFVKAIMFPVSFFFLIPVCFFSRTSKKTFLFSIFSLLIFLAMSGSWIGLISKKAGHFTFSEAAVYNTPFLNKKNEATALDSRTNSRAYPSEEDTMLRPMEHERYIGIPSFHNAGVNRNFSEYVPRLLISGRQLFNCLFSPMILPIFVAFFAGLSYRGHFSFQKFREYGFVYITAVAGIFFYWFSVVQSRYLAPFYVLLWVCILCGFFLRNAGWARKILRVSSMAMFAVVALIIIGVTCFKEKSVFDYGARNFAKELKALGVLPGDKLVITNAFLKIPVYLLQADCIAQMKNVDFFKDVSQYRRILAAGASLGAKGCIARDVPAPFAEAGWKRIPDTDYYMYFFDS